MMAQPVFDTHGFVKGLSAAGMNARQAEALVEALNGAFETLATKADLRELELRLANTLSMRMGAMCAGSTALTVAILGVLIAVS
jgi:hypothetical protein